jgi:predicted negative regulator of RcsB-dependent stress response
MGKHMTNTGQHLSEEELLDHYYGENTASSHAERHLKACAKCADEYSALERDLGSLKSLVPPSRGEGYGEQVWRSIRGSLTVYETRKWSWPKLGFRRPLVLATACVLLMAAAFIAGRVWQQRQTSQTVAVANDPQARQRVVIWVLGDHLDRSERLLVELNHANGKGADAALPLQTEARELLAANRLLRQSAKQNSDPALDAALDRLERLLVELANEPNGLTEADLNRLRQEMNTDGLLFDVRVLRSRVTEQQPSADAGLKGVSI